ncbi:MAG: Ku protein [Nitrospirae bacterium GWD2_57_9]|nr:MAG: Ku protein [Nitrospirae bacterium GWD2_57_9]OGW48442.1 MAG: Ku protein [Nitrospirae bacterium GWC2_57_9]
MARPIWKGHISFGLINIPVTLYPAEQRSELHFNLIDQRNKAKVRYQRVNERTGQEVPWEDIVKGYEYEENEYVLLGDEDFKRADVKATQTVELEDFVAADEINAVYYDKPYYLVPSKAGIKGYVLLRETLKKTKKTGIARVVIRTREYVAALFPRDNALVLDLLRYEEELRKASDYDFPSGNVEEFKVSAREIEMAERFIESLTTGWKPEKYRDQYRQRLMDWIEKKAKTGMVTVAEEQPAEEVAPTMGEDIMQLLRKSLERTEEDGRKKKQKKAA